MENGTAEVTPSSTPTSRLDKIIERIEIFISIACG